MGSRKSKKPPKKSWRSLSQETASTAVLFILTYWFLLSYFNPALLLSPNTATGGDMGSHNYILYYLKNSLLPRLDILGWTPDWYAGMPLLQFYFPLPYLLMAALSLAMPMQVAFKLVTVLGIFTLPPCAYLTMGWIGFKHPAPQIAAVLTLPFLYTEEFSRWGGNIKSTLAGQFSYSLSLSMALLFFGLAYLAIREKRHLTPLSALFAATALSHVFTLTFLVSSSLYFLVKRRLADSIANVKFLGLAFTVGFMLSAWWMLPMVDKISYTSPIGWASGNLEQLFSAGYGGEYFPLTPFHALTAVGVIFWVIRRDERVSYIMFSILMSFLLFLLIPSEALYTVRFFIPSYLLLMLIAAYGASEVLRRIEPVAIAPIIMLVVTIPLINHPATSVQSLTDTSRWTDWTTHAPLQGWIDWNYEGYEAKRSWPTLKAINDLLRELPPGRVMNEYSRANNVFGTERAFENTPMFSGKPVLKGLLMDSAVSTYFIFYMWSEISTNPACPMAEAGCSAFNTQKGTDHLKAYNVRYVVAITDQLRAALRNDTRYTLLAEFNDPPSGMVFDLFELENDRSYVTLPAYEPVRVRTDKWRKISLNWWRNGENLDVPLVFTEKAGLEDESPLKYESRESLENLPRIPLSQDCQVSEEVRDAEVLIDTTCIGKPLLVKITYFPNWKVDGAERIYLASPAFMLIYPTQEHVRLYYGQTASNVMGWALTFTAAALMLYAISARYGLLTQPRLASRMSMDKLLSPGAWEAQAIKRLGETVKTMRGRYARKGRQRITLLAGAILILAAAAIYISPDDGGLSGLPPGGMELTDSIDVGNVSDEEAHAYTISQGTHPITREYTYPGGLRVKDDGRGYRGHEAFEMDAVPSRDLLLVRRLDYSVPNQRVEVYVDGNLVGDMSNPGIDTKDRWRDAQIVIPGAYVTRERTSFKMLYRAGSPDANTFGYWAYVKPAGGE